MTDSFETSETLKIWSSDVYAKSFTSKSDLDMLMDMIRDVPFTLSLENDGDGGYIFSLDLRNGQVYRSTCAAKIRLALIAARDYFHFFEQEV